MAGFIRKIFGHLGGKKEDHHNRKQTQTQGQEQEQGQPVNHHPYHEPYHRPEHRTSPGGFGVKVAVPVEPSLRVPIVSQCTNGHGGVQGLKWYADKLRVDDDGDVAQEFLSEVIPETPGPYNTKRPPRFESVPRTRPAKLKGDVHTHDGNVHQHVESPLGSHWA